jgi:hypothetical protein
MRGIGRHISQIYRYRGNAVVMKMWYIYPVGGDLARAAVLCLGLALYLRECMFFPVGEDFVEQVEPKTCPAEFS